MAVEIGSVTYDGTQPPPPPRLYPDPLAGLVTGESYAGTDPSAPLRDSFEVPIAQPVEIDTEAVQAMVDAAMSDAPPTERAHERSRRARSAHPGSSVGQAVPGMVPSAQRSRPTGQQAWRALKAYPRQHQAQAGRQPRPAMPVKPSKSSTGVIVAIILLVVFGIIAIQLIAAFVEGLSGTFE
ncbi:MAG: hypothetical protein ACRDQW_15600 [Haloechinothrix sp.]